MKYGPTFLGIIEENNVKSGTKERRMFKIVLLFQSKCAKNPQKMVPNYIKSYFMESRCHFGKRITFHSQT